MNVLLLGASGMIGDGVLQECLADARVSSVLALTRAPLPHTHPKLRTQQRENFFDYTDMAGQLAEFDACFFCLGVSAAGMTEAAYRRVTFDLTLALASALAAARPGTPFCYVSGEGTDGTGRGRIMWARVKGETENALLALPLDVYCFRPGFVRPRPGVQSKTRLYRLLYAVTGPLYPLLKRVAPAHVTTSGNVGRAMLAVATAGYGRRILENPDINAIGAATGETARRS